MQVFGGDASVHLFNCIYLHFFTPTGVFFGSLNSSEKSLSSPKHLQWTFPAETEFLC